MRRSTSPSRCSRAPRDGCRSGTRSTPRSICFSVFERGRPSRPSITRLIGRLDLQARVGEQQVHELLRVLAARLRLEHEAHRRAPCRTRRAPCRARTSSRLLRLTCSCDSDFLPSLGFGLVARSMSSSTTRADTPSGSSVTAIAPLAARELLDRPARAHAQAAAAGLVDGADRLGLRDDLAAARQVRARDVRQQLVERDRRIADRRDHRAARLRRRLCEGMSVAMPTPMPDVPFSSSIGRRAGRSFGSLNAPS